MSDELIDIDLNAVTIAKDPTTFTDTEVVTKQFVNTQLTNIIDTAPGTLDTLNELATAINNDGDVHTTITNLVTQEENTRVAADVNFNTEIDTLIANNTKLRRIGWKPKFKFFSELTEILKYKTLR